MAEMLVCAWDFMVRFVVAVLVLTAGQAVAEDVSPWFGGEGQVPFQLITSDAVGNTNSVPVTKIAPRFGVQMALTCSIEGCSAGNGSAKVLEANPFSP